MVSTMEKQINAYLLRVDSETGIPYRGYVGKVENTLEAKQKLVGGRIEVVTLGDIDIILNEDGKLLRLPPNRVLTDDKGNIFDILVGDIICCRHDGNGNFCSIHQEDISVIESFLLPILSIEERGVVLPFVNDILPIYEER